MSSRNPSPQCQFPAWTGRRCLLNAQALLSALSYEFPFVHWHSIGHIYIVAPSIYIKAQVVSSQNCIVHSALTFLTSKTQRQMRGTRILRYGRLPLLSFRIASISMIFQRLWQTTTPQPRVPAHSSYIGPASPGFVCRGSQTNVGEGMLTLTQSHSSGSAAPGRSWL